MYSKSFELIRQQTYMGSSFYVEWMDGLDGWEVFKFTLRMERKKERKKVLGCLEHLYVESEGGVWVNHMLTHHQLRLLCSKVDMGRGRLDSSMVRTLIRKKQARNKGIKFFKKNWCMHGGLFCGFGWMWMQWSRACHIYSPTNLKILKPWRGS